MFERIKGPRQLDERLWELHGKVAFGTATEAERAELDGRCALNERRSAALRAEPSCTVSAVPAAAAIAVGFTGTQRLINGNQKNVLTTFLVGLRNIGAIWMHNGDCIESDEFAGRTWLSLGGSIYLHPPENNSKRAFLDRLPNVVSAPPRPYLMRNQDIALAATAMLATPLEMDEQRKGGTWYTVRAARYRLLPLAILLPDGTVRYERWPDHMADLARDSDGTAIAAINEDLSVPKDCQARAESIAQMTSSPMIPLPGDEI